MKKILLVFTLLTCGFVFSQEDAWVYFNSKPGAASFFANPISELSQRALDRRTNQGISLDFTDAPIEQTYIDALTVATGIEVKAKSKWLNCVHVRGSVADINALHAYTFVSQIIFADPALNTFMQNNQPILNKKTIQPVHKKMDIQTNFSYGNSFNQIQMLNGNLLHQQNYTGAGKIIAVMDAGFPGVDVATPYQRLFNNNLILGGYNFVDKTANVYTLNSHGSMVLSCMGGYVDGQLVGTAPDASYYLFITEDVASENPVEESNWVEAAEEADRLGVDIITTSLGYFAYDNPAYSHSYADMTGDKAFISKGANLAFSKGMVCVASAGNEGSNTEPHIGVPAEALHELAVGAVQADRSYATFSSIGPSFDGRVKPDVMAQGQASVVSNPSGNLITASGTSFSGPIMAGMVACLWQALPTLSNQQVVNFIKESADRFTNPDFLFGYGIPDFQLALNMANLNVKESLLEESLVYPNPTNDKVTILFPSTINLESLKVYNTLGQKVKEIDSCNNPITFSLADLESGIYYYEIMNVTKKFTGKIIKK